MLKHREGRGNIILLARCRQHQHHVGRAALSLLPSLRPGMKAGRREDASVRAEEYIIARNPSGARRRDMARAALARAAARAPIRL